MYVDPDAHTMSMLYGNGVVMQSVYARGNTSASAPVYSPGSVLALVTWVQRDDPHWFGARIPAVPKVCGVCASGNRRPDESLSTFWRHGMTEIHVTAPETQKRVNFILDLAPARLP